jgi:hypothetical protein
VSEGTAPGRRPRSADPGCLTGGRVGKQLDGRRPLIAGIQDTGVVLFSARALSR